MTDVTRRAAIAAAAGASLVPEPASAQPVPMPERGGEGAGILGPRNPGREA